MNNSNDTFKIQELIVECLKNIREFFQVHLMSNYEMVDHQKVCRVTLTQSVIRDRKNTISASRAKRVYFGLVYSVLIYTERSIKNQDNYLGIT